MSDPRVAMSVRIRPGDRAVIERLAKERGITASALVAYLVQGVVEGKIPPPRVNITEELTFSFGPEREQDA